MVLVLAAAVLSTLPVPEHPAPVVNELPAIWDTPLCVTVDEVTAEWEIDGPGPLTEALDLLDHHIQPMRCTCPG